MSKQAYIVKAYRTAVGKANKGGFRFARQMIWQQM